MPETDGRDRSEVLAGQRSSTRAGNLSEGSQPSRTRRTIRRRRHVEYQSMIDRIVVENFKSLRRVELVTAPRLTVPEHPRLLPRFFQSLRCPLVGQASLARRRRVQLLSGQEFSHGQDLDAWMLAPR